MINDILNKFGLKMEQLNKEVKEDIYPVVTERSGAAKRGKVLSSLQSLYKVKKNAAQLFVLYFTNQFVFRGINIRASELVSRGYEIVGKDKTGIDKCKKLIENSGEEKLFSQLSINTDVGGDGWLEKIYSKDKKEIVKLEHIHPATFGFKTDKFDNIILNSQGQPASCTQTVVDELGREISIDVDIDRIEHLTYIKVGDEFTGISSIQPVYNTAVRLMNMEDAAAHAAVKTANPLWVGTSKSRSPRDLLKWNKILGRISSREQVMLPDGMELQMMSPEKQLFSDYAGYYLDAIVSSLGIPRIILTGSSEGSNRASSTIVSRHFYTAIRSCQSSQSRMINKIFKEYGEIANFDPPKLVFNDTAENAESIHKSAIELFNSGLINQDEARMMIGLEKGGITIDADLKKDEKKGWHPSTQSSPGEGTQTGNKRKQKFDFDVKSVK